ncbi:hypothetical protein BJ508DRAFT_416148 [Ascobolus immersus RN42]|uniref:Uncharacterized protein n=1 Tax=Ascobolus immersus RN42 TaxID=1160509 RepID=A0A3N4I4F9_ASCIM|nr:hypothetical protein BJ508DRAFT_416148 [Ascobolus immersus RN42]
MSATPSPVLSPAHLGGETQFPMPSTGAPLSKRDKRRNALALNLATISDGFDKDRDKHYRNQLAALQQDLHAIASLDASGMSNTLLDDTAEGIERMLTEAIAGFMHVQNPEHPIGTFFSKFVEEVNQHIEERDLSLALLHKRHEDRLADLSHQHHRNLYHARIEHLHLATTVKNRLISRLTATKKKLATDKEHIEFTDSNLNLPVSQLNQQPYMSPSRDVGANGNDNYSSGVGAGSSRRRQLRHRKNGDDILNPDFTPNKRKRRTAHPGSPMLYSRYNKYDDDDDLDCLDSPGDSQTPLPKPQHYQIDQLFNKQELSFASSLAAIASVRFQTPQNYTKHLLPLTYENAEKELSNAQNVVGTRSNHLNLPSAGTTKNQTSPGPAPLRPDDSIEDLEMIRRAVGDSTGRRGGGWGGGGMKRTASGAGFGGGEGHKKRR